MKVEDIAPDAKDQAKFDLVRRAIAKSKLVGGMEKKWAEIAEYLLNDLEATITVLNAVILSAGKSGAGEAVAEKLKEIADGVCGKGPGNEV